jgi:hypothetical protein
MNQLHDTSELGFQLAKELTERFGLKRAPKWYELNVYDNGFRVYKPFWRVYPSQPGRLVRDLWAIRRLNRIYPPYVLHLIKEALKGQLK